MAVELGAENTGDPAVIAGLARDQDLLGTHEDEKRSPVDCRGARSRGTLAKEEPEGSLDGIAARLAAEEVRLAETEGELGARRVGVESLWGVVLAYLPVVDYRDTVGERERLVLVVGDEQRSRTRLFEHTPDVLAQDRPQARVEGGERLVQQHERRFDGERPGEGYALLLATGELVGIAPFQPAQPDHVQQLANPLPAPLTPGQAEADVLFHRQVREQAPVLGHEADTSPIGRHVVIAVVDDLAGEPHHTAVGTFEACDHPQQRRLPASRRPEDGGERSRDDREVEAAQHGLATV